MAMNEKEKNALTAGLILAAVLLIAVLYFHFMMFSPQHKARQAQVTKVSDETKKLERDLASMNAFLKERSEIEVMEKQITRVTSKLPSEANAIEFLEELRDSLERTSVKQSRVEPRQPAPRNLYTEIPYVVQASARYHEFGQFLNLIECNPRRFMRVNSFDIRNNASRPTIHPVTVGISTFMFNRR